MSSEISLHSKITQAKALCKSKLIVSFKTNHSQATFVLLLIKMSIVTHGAMCAVSDYHKAYLFNQYFHSVFTKSSFQLPPVSDSTPLTNISEIVISELDVYNALSSLDTTKASGCDGISAKLLKYCTIALYQTLHHLFSLSLSQHYIPLEWRTHLIRPIFKPGDKHDAKNYRPISLLCVVSKVLERLVFDHMIDFVRGSVSTSQFGFYKVVPFCSSC